MTLRARLVLILVATSVPLIIGIAWLRQELIRREGSEFYRKSVLARMAASGRAECEANPAAFGPHEDEIFSYSRGAPGRRSSPRPGAATASPGASVAAGDSAGEEASEATLAGSGEAMGPASASSDEAQAVPQLSLSAAPAAASPTPKHRSRRRSWIREVYAYDASFRAANPQAPPFPEALRKSLESGTESASTRGDPTGHRSGWRSYEVAMRMDWNEGPCAVLLTRFDGPAFSRYDKRMVRSVAGAGLGFLVILWIAAGPSVRRIRRLTEDVRRSAATRYATPVRMDGKDEIADLARAFNEAGADVRAHLATVEQRERTLRTFLANTTHDVMLPLTVLQGHISALSRVESEADGSAKVAAAQEEAHYIASLLHNLGAVARLDAGEPLLGRDPVDLCALVERVVERHRPIARARGIELGHAVPEQPIQLLGDVTLLEQAVSNVVHNAIRYNHTDGHVAVILEPAAEGRFRLKVADDGPGVSPAEIARLTERRFRSDEARTREPGGLGIGLSIARDVAERHGILMDLRPSSAGGLEVLFEGKAS